jgi:hypothetical protein
MPSLPGCGRDLRLLCGYIRIKRNECGDSWYDNWINSLVEHHPEPETLIFEIVGRCGATVFIADKLVEILRTRRITPQLVGLLIFSRWNEDLPANNLENVLRAMNDTGLQESAIVILGERMRSHPNEIRIWDPLALQLVTSPLLIRSNQMTSYHWKEVANTLLPVHIGEIAAAIIHEHAERNRNGWYLEFSSAAIVLHDCTDREPKVVWRILQPYLSSPDAHRFIFGFPRGILDMIPFEEISGWIAENPIEHTVLISNLVEMNFSNDDTLAARMIGEYGNTDRVAGAFLSEYLTGTWWGPASIHWEQLATDLEEVIKRTAIPALRNWAINSARQLHEMAARERRRQEEEEIRGY